MAIEFRCTQCGNLLRTGDDTAGKSAKCPQCGAVMPIPAASVTPDGTGPTDFHNPYPSSGSLAGVGPNPTQGSIAPTVLDLNDIFSRTWSIFKEQWSLCLVGFLIVLVLTLIISLGLSYGGELAGRIVFGPKIGSLFYSLGNLAGQLLSIWLGIGAAIFFLKIARGQAASVDDLFSGGPFYVKILLATLLFMVVFYVGILLCIVPGVIFALTFSQFYYLVLDRGLPILDAFRQSKDLMVGNKLTLFLIWLATMGICLVAAIPCGLGLLVAWPFVALMYPVIYLTITGQPTADQLPIGPTT